MCRLITIIVEVLTACICLLLLVAGFIGIIILSLYLEPHGGLPHAPEPPTIFDTNFTFITLEW